MNYTDVMNALKNASLFDLYRLSVAIGHEMENPERIHQVRQSFKEGDTISYFDRNTNSLIEAIVSQKNPKNVLVKNVKDQKTWRMQYCMLNIARINIDVHSDKLSKNNLKCARINLAYLAGESPVMEGESIPPCSESWNTVGNESV